MGIPLKAELLYFLTLLLGLSNVKITHLADPEGAGTV